MKNEACMVCEALKNSSTLGLVTEYENGFNTLLLNGVTYCPICGRKLSEERLTDEELAESSFKERDQIMQEYEYVRDEYLKWARCPKCGARLQEEVITTIPPIHAKRCFNCGYFMEEV